MANQLTITMINFNELGFILSVNVSNPDADDYDLFFGFLSITTDGYDQGYCSDSDFTEYGECRENSAIWYGDQYAPPAPPAGVLDAALLWNGERYYNQSLDNSEENAGIEHEFGISVAYDASDSIIISWNNGTSWYNAQTLAFIRWSIKK